MESYHDMNDNLNLSDIIEMIHTNDPDFSNETQCQSHQTAAATTTTLRMMSGGSVETVKPQSNPNNKINNVPYIEIVEQPASKSLRFRYECEGRSAGSIPGVNSTLQNKTFPSIRVVGYQGRAVVVVSCVTKDLPYRPHPHNLVGRDSCKRGVCTVQISSKDMSVVFANLGIQCVKKKDIEEALRIREEIRVDPFRTGFNHKKQPTSIDLNSVRLCFQVFLEGNEGKFTVPLTPVVSDPIYDKKSMSDLVICKLSHCSASVAGGTEMMLLCEKVAKDDIQVRFFEERDNKVVWEGLGDFQPSQVHKQVAIAFRTPTYRTQQVDEPVEVYIQLRRPSDNLTSDALPFQMLPLGAEMDDPDYLKRKRIKLNNNPSSLVLQHVQAEADKSNDILLPPMQYNYNLIKTEPVDLLGAAGGSPLYPMPSTSPSFSINPPILRPIKSPKRSPSPRDYLSPYDSPESMQTNLNLQYPQLSPSAPIICPNDFAQVYLPAINRDVNLNQLNNQGNVKSVLDLDSNQLSFDMNVQMNSLNPIDSADLEMLGNELSENLSAGLSISGITKEPSINKPNNSHYSSNNNNGIEEMNCNDSFTQLTTRTIQELCSLNEIYKPTSNID